MATYVEFKPDESYRHTVLSGVELSQDVADHTVTQSNADLANDVLVRQSFRLPVKYKRGDETTPEITGVQICCTVADADAFTANIVLTVEEFGDELELARGSISGAPAVGPKVWIDVYFNQPIPIPDEYMERFFHLGISTKSPIWYAYPSTFFGTKTVGLGGALTFRLLTNTADNGVDFLGNRYRSVVRRTDIENVSTVASPDPNTFWYSKPNPSKFAVESLYFDVSDGLGHAQVVDRLLLDPITPNVYFNIYYSNEGVGATTEAEWENKLWTPVFYTFKAERRQEHALPEPVTAKFMKVEFSHLQPQTYVPGPFQQKLIYKKHPKWVLSYFLARFSKTTEDPNVSSRVRVVFDALSLAYQYYTDDLESTPNIPAQLERVIEEATNDTSDMVDSDLLDQIHFTMKPYLSQPATLGITNRTVLSELARSQIGSATYSTEVMSYQGANTTQVSSLNREALILENNYPVMFFYLTCRHKYREVEAYLADDKAYFVGVRELAFTREHYTAASDNSLYVENLGDFTNVIRNDFIEEDYLPFKPNPQP
jgi:hypothetical protein